MIIDVDLTVVPPAVSLTEADDFKAFKIVTRGEHGFVARETLVALAGERGSDPAWLERLDAMLAYAASKGWADAAGATRAHVEHAG
ncbi:MAG TPA: hypothetical protein VNT55_05305 [Baekduia sp.]|nr:hypothetical protein [Baekduia sp.]